MTTDSGTAAREVGAPRPRLEDRRLLTGRGRFTDDVAPAINPLILHGQARGAIVQGVGQALMEAIRYAPEDGQLVTGTFLDYALPRADTVPPIRTLTGEWWKRAAADDERLQVLRPHHGPHVHPLRLVRAVAHDRGEAHEDLSGRTDGGNPASGADAGLEAVRRLVGQQSTEVARIEERRSPAVDEDAGRPLGSARTGVTASADA